MTYTYNYNFDSSDAVLGGMLVGDLITFLVIYVLSVIAMWKIFTKAGKPGWASLIPIYNIVVMYQIVGLNPLLIILLFIPFINGIAAIVLSIIQCIKLSKAFGNGTGFTFGLIFLSPIFLLILGFGNDKYMGFEQ